MSLVEGRRPAALEARSPRSQRATVAVLMPTYNHGHYLPESLAAIAAQTRPPDEIVIVDDGSTDDTPEILRDFAGRQPHARLVRHPVNLGVQASMARLLGETTADYLVAAAADDRVLPAFLETSMAALERHPRAGLCFSELSVIRDGSDAIERLAVHPQVSHIFDLSGLPAYLSPAAIVERMRRTYLPMPSNTVVVRRDALVALGGYPPALEWYADSFAYTVVALRHGACPLPESLALIRARPGSYSHRGMGDPERERRVLLALLEHLGGPDARDVRQFYRRCPSAYPSCGTLLLRLQLRRPRDWDLLAPYLIRKMREYRRDEALGWPRTLWQLGTRAIATIVGAAPDRERRALR